MELVKDPGTKGRGVGDADSVLEVPVVVTAVKIARAAEVGVAVEWVIRVGKLDVVQERVVDGDVIGRQQVAELLLEVRGEVGRAEARESVGLVGSSRLVDDLHVGLKVGQLLRPASLTTGEVSLSHQVLEGLVVSEDSEVLASLKVVAEDLQGVDDGQEFLFMHRVVLLCRAELPRLVTYRLRSIALVLQEDSADAIARGVGVELKSRLRPSGGDDKERGGEQSGLQVVEGGDGGWGNDGGKRGLGPGEVSQRNSDLGVVTDEAAVEASEAKEGTDSGDVSR
jgi:hypothetical protein